MIIAPTTAVHTFGMRFPIDIAVVTQDGRIVKSRSDVPPFRIVAALRGFAVIELPAGTLHRHDTVDGDRLVIERMDQALANIASCTDQTMTGSQRDSGCFPRVFAG